MAFRLLLVVNILVFGLPFLVDLSAGANFSEYILSLGSVKGFSTGLFEIYQLFTAPFLHANLIHLLVNMVALGVSVGPDVNKLFKNSGFSIIYLISALGGSFLSAVFSTNLAGSVGASGAIMGLVGAIAAFAVKTEQRELFWSVFGVILINLYFGSVVPQVDNWGHIGGLLAGFVVGYFLITPRLRDPKPIHYRDDGQRVIEGEAVNI